MDQVKEHLRGLCGYTPNGEEIPDSRPVEMPIGFKRPKTLQETMRDLLRSEEVRRAMDARDLDTFDEADDFDDEDNDDPIGKATPYEEHFDPLHTTAREQEIRGGFVEEVPLERKERARTYLEEHRRKMIAAEQAQAPLPDKGAKKKPKVATDEEE